MLMPVVACAGVEVVPKKHSGAYAQFDIETLKTRGVDPRLAEYFREAAKFSEGSRVVSLLVNGKNMGRASAQFDHEGELCFDIGLLSKAQLRVPSSEFALSPQGVAAKCYDLVAAYPQTEVSLRPNRAEVFLVVPQHALKGDAVEAADFSHGGSAALINYDVMAMRSRFAGISRDYLSGATELGFNAGDWIMRSRQVYTKREKQVNFRHLYAYGQRTFTDQKALVQAGEININSPLFSGASILGIQILPETALKSAVGSGAIVEGIAHSQSTVEVRQAGVLIYTTIVPEGPFSLSDIPLINSGSDLDVGVRDINGTERRYVVSAASFRTAGVARPGYTFATGKVRRLGYSDAKPSWVATGTGTWNVLRDLTATAGLMGTQYYQSIGWGGDTRLKGDTTLSVRNLHSVAVKEGVRGTQASVALSSRLTEAVSASVSATQQTIGYRNLLDTTQSTNMDWYRTRYQSQYSASFGWSSRMLGSFNLSVAPSRTFEGDSSNRLVGSWGQTFKSVTVSASVETSLSGSTEYGSNENTVYMSVSVPLGAMRSVRTYASRRGDRQRAGAMFSDVVNDSLSYHLSTEHSGERGASYSSANVSARPLYTSLELGYAQGDESQNYNGRLSGGVVAHKSGVTLSPYQVQDTFGIIKVGDLPGVKIATPSGPVWTDKAGEAVVPQLRAYRQSRIEVQTQSLPRRADLQNGFQVVGAGRGSVSHLQFNVIKAQRLLISAFDGSGRPLPKGSSVLGGKNNFLTTVLDNGTIFLTDSNPEQVFMVSLPDETSCLLNIDFPAATDNDAFYDVTTAVCHAA